MWCRYSCIFMLILFAIIESSLQATLGLGNTTDSNYVFEIQDYLDFENKIIKSPTKVLVQFHAPWCQTCKVLSPLLIKYTNKNKDKLILARVDMGVEELKEIASEHGIRNVPIIAIFKGGKVIDKLIGFKSEKITSEFVEKHAKD